LSLNVRINMSKSKIMKKSIVKKTKLNRIPSSNEREFQAGFNDCIIDCMTHLIDKEKLNINHPILQEMLLHLMNERDSFKAK
jgi:hypothetical protein